MGVHGLWQLLHSAGRPITLESLDGKILAVDVSIWLNKAAKGMRDKFGNPVYNAHLILIFHRICKLLFYNVRPVFVFDGAVPELKKRTLAIRKERRMMAQGNVNRVSEKMMQNYLKGKALEAVTGQRGPKPLKISKNREEDIFDLPPMPVKGEAESSSEEEVVDADTDWMTGMKSEQVERMFENISSVDFESDEFKAYPPEIQHELLTEMKDSYRRRYNKKKSQPMPEVAEDFSDFQLKNLFRRGKITKTIDDVRKTMNTRSSSEIAELDEREYLRKNAKSVEARRVASEDRKHYILMKKSGKKGGENILFNTELELDKVDVYKELKKSENFEKLEREPAIFKEAFMDNWTTMAFLSESSEDSDFDDDEDKIVRAFSVDSKSKNEVGVVTDDSIEEEGVELGGDRLEISGDDSGEEVKENSNTTNNHVDLTVEVTCQELDSSVREIAPKQHLLDDDLNMDSDEREFGNKQQNAVNPNASIDKASEQNNSNFDSEVDFSEPTDRAANTPSPQPLMDAHHHEPEADVIEVEDTDATHSASLCSDVSKDNQRQRQSFEIEEVEMWKELTFPKDGIDVENGDASAYPKPVSTNETAVSNALSDEEDTTQQFKNEIQGRSLDGLRAMQNSINEEQDQLQRERERHTRAAASVGSEEYRDVQELLRLFGIPYITSPMEAEAQCALLDLTNQTDGSVCDDSDIFLFGARRVYKNIFNQERYAEFYTKDNIYHLLNLNREKLIAIAFLSGSDYTEGIQGIGAITAMEVLQEFGGDSLQPLIRLRNWFEDVKQIDAFSRIQQGTKLKNKLLNLELPRGFPNDKVWEAYINPTVDTSEEQFEWGKPDAQCIREFAKRKFGWSNSRTDELLLPVIKNVNQRKDQSNIEKYFGLDAGTAPHVGQIESKRLKRVVNLMRSGVTGDTSTTASASSNSFHNSGINASHLTTGEVSANIRKRNAKSNTYPLAIPGGNKKSKFPTVQQFKKRLNKSRGVSRIRGRKQVVSFSVRSSKLPNKDMGSASKPCLSGSSSDSDA
eukprot:gene11202-12377_t